MKIGTVKGINIKLHYSTLLIVALAGYSASSFFSNILPAANLLDVVLFGVLSGIIILVSILAHELMHSIIAQVDGSAKAVLHLEHARNFPPEERQKTLVKEIMQPLDSLSTIDVSTNAKEAYQEYKRNSETTDVLLVTENNLDEIVDFLERSDFKQAIQVLGASNQSL